ncbi:hypothetical protein AYL99_01722 [Fonsecaea erecta]|uniref:Uncharacterized protein n=1 Tax=Fonsecaea erecta TaxID=1367422 RepID=A0A179A0R5_9EURO|nr:hypothetical protein AYL99_01722 [Fonsecaea erecta]OAP65750.1 hypothetical protein AYL99_01722 [Fonsecaea erecta]
MDPLSALGLAGNIINIVDYSTKVVSRAKQLYGSATGATAENTELETLTKGLKSLIDQTRNRPAENPPRDRFRLSNAQGSALQGLARQCTQVADELLECLDSVKVRSGRQPLRSATQAVKSIWKQDHIDSLQRRLDRISKQLMDGMHLELLDDINRRLRELALENMRLEANRSQEIGQLRREFNFATEEMKRVNADENHAPGFWLVLCDTARRGQAYFAEQIILQSLRFSAIDSRHRSISKEHAQTFLWMFDETSPTRFLQWLEEEEESVYWISGRAGSGKSTLMKFVADHEQTERSLKAWAGDMKLVTASFFFWKASSRHSQTSQQGLLRTILYQVLRQCPDLIQVAYSDQWIALTTDGILLKESRDELLTVPALLETLRKISTSTASDTKFCFFIDGLDEYDGRPADIMQLIDILRSFQNVKTCVSSRPWNEFEDRFGSKSPWKLYIHDLTREDIRLYVQDTLGRNPRFRQLQKEDPKCPDFVQNIVHDAAGVFLWVSLVVRSLLDGLTNSDRIKDLQGRLHEIPKDLKDYFEKILFSTENRYRTQTSRIFAVAVNAYDELPLMAYWVVDQDITNYAFQCSAKTPAKDVLFSRLRNMKRRLKMLSRGLLEVAEIDSASVETLLYGNEVGFLHRTVKDYLQTEEARLMLQARSDDDFEADWEILNSLCALAKMTPPYGFYRGSGSYRVLRFYRYSLTDFWPAASRLDRNPLFQQDLASILDHLQTVLTSKLKGNAQAFEEDDEFRIFKDGLKIDLIAVSACFCFGLSNLVGRKIEQDPGLCRRVTAHLNAIYLVACSELKSSRIGPLERESIIATLELLLAQGVDPNRGLGDQLDWFLILDSLPWDLEIIGTGRPREDRTEGFECFEAVKLLVRYGADFEQERVGISYPHGVERASQVLRRCFNADQCAVLEDIAKQRASKLKESQKMPKKTSLLKLWIRSKK